MVRRHRVRDHVRRLPGRKATSVRQHVRGSDDPRDEIIRRSKAQADVVEMMDAGIGYLPIVYYGRSAVEPMLGFSSKEGAIAWARSKAADMRENGWDDVHFEVFEEDFEKDTSRSVHRGCGEHGPTA